MPADDWEPDEFTGSDGSGAIRVVVDASGTVTDVVVAANWRDKVPPGELGVALTAATNLALSSRFAHRVEHAEVEADIPRDARPDARDAGGDPSSPVARDRVREIAGLLAVFERDFATYQRELREAAANATAGARSTKGAIEVTMEHGLVAAVTVNPSWAKSAGNADVRAEVLGALTAAAGQLARAGPSAVTPPASIARLRELAGDPNALSKEMGLS